LEKEAMRKTRGGWKKKKGPQSAVQMARLSSFVRANKEVPETKDETIGKKIASK